MLWNKLAPALSSPTENLFFQSMSAGTALPFVVSAYHVGTKSIISATLYLNTVCVYSVKTSGELNWQKTITCSNNATNRVISVNSTGTIFVAITVATTPSSVDIVTLNADGSFISSLRISDSVALNAVSAVSDTSGNVYVLLAATSSPAKVVVLKVSSSNTLTWARQVTDTVSLNAVNLGIESSGNLLLTVFKTTGGQRYFIYRITDAGSSIFSYSLSTTTGTVLTSPDGGVFLVGHTVSTTSYFIKYSSDFTTSVVKGSVFGASAGQGVVVGDSVLFRLAGNTLAISDLSLNSPYVKTTSTSPITHNLNVVSEVNGKLVLGGTAQTTGAYNDAIISRLDLSNLNGNYGTSKFVISDVSSTWTTGSPPAGSTTLTSTFSTYTPTTASSSPTVTGSSLTPGLYLKA